MNKEQLIEALSFLFEDEAELGFEMFIVLNSEEGLQIKVADLGDDDLSNEIKDGFLDYIEGRTIENEEAQVRRLSELNAQLSTIHSYDMGDLPEGLEIINNELNSELLETFSFDDDDLTDIKAFLLKITSVDSQVVLYKHHSHLSLITQKNGLLMVGRNERFIKPANDQGILRFSFTMDFLKVGENIMVYDLKCLERQFKFDNVLINKAEEQIDEIEDLGFVDNIDELRDFVSEKSGAKKVLKLRKDSPVLKMPFNDIRSFVKNDKFLKRRFHFNDDESQFHLHTKASREYFIKLMNDDYLTSELTKTRYDSESKDEMVEEEAAE